MCLLPSSISHANRVMLKILQARLHQYMNWELPDVQSRFRRGRGTRDQIANICWIIEKARESRMISTSASLTVLKPLTVRITTNCGKILQEMGIPDHLTCLLRNLYASQEATIRIRHGTTDWFKIGKRVLQGCILSPCLFNFYAEYIMWNTRKDETQAGIKISGRNINNLMAESEEGLKRLFNSSSIFAMNDVICIAEVIDIFPGNLDSSLCFIQPSISHDVLCI